MSDYTEFFLNSKSANAQLECLEFFHSSFSQTYRVVRNAVHGVTVTHEDTYPHDYTYYPLRLSLSGPRDDLDHILSIQFGDLGTIIPVELDALRAADTFGEKPQVVYRTYSWYNLDVPLYGPLYLEVKRFTITKDGATFEAKAPSLNNATTGEKYSMSRFPMLRGLL